MTQPARARAALPCLLALLVAAPAVAQFASTEVSGPGSATPFRVAKAGWSWEDIPGVTYSVYRSAQPDTGFECILDGHVGPAWLGDQTDPGPGGLFHYLVTAYDGVDDNSPGTWSNGTPRTLSVRCPRVPPCPSGTPVTGRVPLQLVSVGRFTGPIFLTAPPGDTSRVFILERAGRIQIRRNDGTRTQFLDFSANVITGSERGALGLAFHPDYATNGKLYVHYSAPPSGACGPDNCATIVEYTVSADPEVADPASARILLQQPDPFGNHNGGWLAFGPDGYLYCAFGDGGSGGDPLGSGQNLGSRLGKLLRIDVNGRDPGLQYAVPPTNPFVGQAGALPEIWCYGVRNPWRNAFDRANGDLYIADVGQGAWEEVDVAPAAGGGARGLNYGWNVMEGAHCYSPATGCDQTGKTLPDHEYPHSDGCSITGGYVYRGCRMPDWQGAYFFTDYCGGWLDTFDYSGGVGATLQRLFPSGALLSPVSFGEDGAGEIYVIEGGGTVYRIEPM